MEDFRYRAFISYSHGDEKVASWFHRYLERYRIPSEVVVANNLPSSRLKPIFRDKDELSTSSDLGAEIRLALEQSESMIVMCSTASRESKWVNEEVSTFCRLGRADRIHCIVVEGKPPEIFPPVLLKNDTEPLAVDIRPGGDSRRIAAVKVLAGISRISFDDLHQRERRATRQQSLVLGSAILLALVLTSILYTSLAPFALLITSAVAIYALIQRNSAQESRTQADNQRSRAEEEASTSDEVSKFLEKLFANADPIHAGSGGLTAQDLLDTGSRNLQNDLDKQPLVRARLLRTIGQAYIGLGAYESARHHLDDALAIQLALLGECDEEVARSRVARAWVHISMSETEAAISLYGQLGVVEHWREWEFEHEHPHILAINDYGIALYDLGRYDEAGQVLRRAIQINEQLELHSDLAASLTNLALVTATSNGPGEESAGLYNRALEILENEFGAADPQLVVPLLNATSSYQKFDKEKANSGLEQAATIVADAYDKDHPLSGFVNNRRGIFHYRSGEYEKALGFFIEAARVRETVFGDEHESTAADFQFQARCYLKLGDLTLSRQLYERSIHAYNESAGPEHPDSTGPYVELAELLVQMGNDENALPLINHAMENARKHIQMGWADDVLQRGEKLLASIGHTHDG